MPSLQEQYDDGMFDFSMGDYESAIRKFKEILAEDSQHFDAQLSLERRGELLDLRFRKLLQIDRLIPGHGASSSDGHSAPIAPCRWR